MLNRRTPLKRKTPLKATKPMRKVSKRQAKINREYTELRRQFLMERPMCEWPEGCSRPSQDVHHTQGRGPHMLDVDSWKATCREHHDYCHFVNPRHAREIGWIID